MANDMGTETHTQQFWNAYARAARIDRAECKVFRFGDSAELADELVQLVIAGKKRATTSLRRDFSKLGQPDPQPGTYAVILDGQGAPRCIIRTVRVEIKPMREVDDRYAWDEGGGDRSLAWWRASHARYFKRQGLREGFSVDDGTEVVLERFEVVWPPEFADQRIGRI